MEVEEIFLSCDVGPSIGLIVDLRLTCESPEDGGKASLVLGFTCWAEIGMSAVRERIVALARNVVCSRRTLRDSESRRQRIWSISSVHVAICSDVTACLVKWSLSEKALEMLIALLLALFTLLIRSVFKFGGYVIVEGKNACICNAASLLSQRL